MPEQATILRLVVASPSDVQGERDLVSKVVEEINHGVADERRLIVRVTKWEDNAFPGFASGGPQALIDSILRIPDCDIFLAILWKRFGTPVGDAMSGNEHEFKLAYESWKQKGCPQIFFYFNQGPSKSKSSAEAEQEAQVLKFQERFPKEGLWWRTKGHDSSKSFSVSIWRHIFGSDGL